MDTRFQTPYSNPRWWWDGDYLPTCFSCTYFRGAIRGEICCEAFPEGIPAELMKKGAIHDTPYPGDRGIQYQRYVDEGR